MGMDDGGCMKFKIEDRGPKAEVRYAFYVKERFLFFPIWTWSILGGASTKEKVEEHCQNYYDQKTAEEGPKKITEFSIP